MFYSRIRTPKKYSRMAKNAQQRSSSVGHATLFNIVLTTTRQPWHLWHAKQIITECTINGDKAAQQQCFIDHCHFVIRLSVVASAQLCSLGIMLDVLKGNSLLKSGLKPFIFHCGLEFWYQSVKLEFRINFECISGWSERGNRLPKTCLKM